MSPEQAKGRDVDHRADIWAFGCVLFEMLAGARAFAGDDVTDTLAAVLLKEPDWSCLPDSTPRMVRRLIEQCLRKDSRQRLQHIGDARLDLEEGASADVGASPPSQQRFSSQMVAALAGVGIVLVAVAGLQTWRLARVDTVKNPVRFSITPPRDVDLGSECCPLAVVSPDGTRIVFAYKKGGHELLYSRRLDEADARPIAGTEGGERQAFSPDGGTIVFNAGGLLKTISLEGGPELDLVNSGFGTAAWAPDKTIIYTPNYTMGLWKMPSARGTPVKLTEPAAKDGELGHFWPQILPDGKTVLFTSFRTPDDRSRIEVYSLHTGQRKVIVDGGFFGQYVPTGHLLFARAGNVMAVRFDPVKLETIGESVPVIADIAFTPGNGVAQFSVSPTGTLAFMRQEALSSPRQLVWIDRNGRTSPASDEHKLFADPSLSPDGRSVALTIREARSSDVWVYNFDRSNFNRITSSPSLGYMPVWAPDSRRLFYIFEEPVFHIYSRAIGMIGEPERVLGGPFDLSPQSVPPDGRYLVYIQHDPSTRRGIWMLPLIGDRTPRVFIDTAAAETAAAISPDGKWLAYTSDQNGRDEIYVQAFPAGGQLSPVSSGGGTDPHWSRDGSELFFREGDKMMAAQMRGGTIARPTMLFEKRIVGFDVARDGRFIAVVPDPAAPPPSVNIVLNWFEELKRLVPER